MKRLFVIALQLVSLSPLFAQITGEGETLLDTRKTPGFFQRLDEKSIFNNLNVSVTAGSTGFGIDVGTPLTEYAQLRVGFDFMPSFEKIVNFGVQVGEKLPGQTDEEYAAVSHSKFETLSGFLKSFTGQKVEDNVDMIGSPSFHNFKLLVDVHPFAKSTSSKFLRNVYVTAGFYWGNSNIAKAYNTTEDMPTLFSVNMYNGMHEKFSTDYYLYNDFLPGFGLDPDVIDIIGRKFKAWGRMGMHIGDYAHDGEQRYYDEDVPVLDEYGIPVFDDNDEPVIAHRQGEPMFDENGNPVLTYYKGDPYMMEPDEDCMVKARIKANSFKPYLGLGYGTNMAKSQSGWGISVDAGALFWGGAPSVVTHDGTDLNKDLENVRGKVGRYVRLINKFKVYPVVNMKLTKRLFNK